MEPEFITYQKFNDVALANELAEQLEMHGIEYNIEEQSSGFDPSMVMSNAPVDYAVKIKGSDFEKANQLLKEDESVNIEGVEKDYYLFSFTDDELIDLIAKADEWSVFDTVLARKILTERGKDISDKAITVINDKRIEALKEPEPPQTAWIIMGYIFAFAGGVIGIFIGWHLLTYKRTLPNGERVLGYNEHDRKQGKRILYIAIIFFTIGIILKVIEMVYG